MISVLVPTLNRSNKIKSCLKSILTSSYREFEVLIIDQSADHRTENAVKKLNSQKIKYFKISSKGKSKALNFAIPNARGDIIAFTDDDCIVDRNWLKETVSSFRAKRDISGVLGIVLPYRPWAHKGEVCLAVSMNRKEHFARASAFRFEDLGMGTNMVFRKSIFKKIGNFKWWLGVGSISRGGIESEFIYRVIRNNKIVYINPEVKVFHDRWMKVSEEQKKQNQYACGFIAFCFYYLFKGDLKVLPLIYAKLKRRIGKRLVASLKTKSAKIILSTIFSIFEETFYYVRGVFLGFYFRFFENFYVSSNG